MQPITYLSPGFAVTSALSPEDYAEAARLGFRTILNHRPDGEEDGQATARESALLAHHAGLSYRHLPATKYDLFTNEVVGGTAAIIDAVEGPVLAHCKSGLRSAIAWAAAQSRTRPVDDVLADIRAAGMDLDFLRDEFEMQADQAHWSADTPPASPARSEAA